MSDFYTLNMDTDLTWLSSLENIIVILVKMTQIAEWIEI